MSRRTLFLHFVVNDMYTKYVHDFLTCWHPTIALNDDRVTWDGWHCTLYTTQLPGWICMSTIRWHSHTGLDSISSKADGSKIYGLRTCSMRRTSRLLLLLLSTYYSCCQSAAIITAKLRRVVRRTVSASFAGEGGIQWLSVVESCTMMETIPLPIPSSRISTAAWGIGVRSKFY